MWRAPQRIISAFVQTLNAVAVEAVVADLHPGSECANGGKLLDREADGLRGGGKATIAQRLLGAASAPGHEQFSRPVVVECHRSHSRCAAGAQAVAWSWLSRRPRWGGWLAFLMRSCRSSSVGGSGAVIW